MKQILALVVFAMSMLSPVPAVAAGGCVTQGYGVSARSSNAWFKRADVWIYGDSITYQTYPDLRARTSARIAVDAHWGRDTKPAVIALRRDLRRFGPPQVVVMATGTNDLLNLDEFARQARRVRALLPRGVKLIWVNIYLPANPDYNLANRIISAVPRTRLVAWARANSTSSAQLLRSDGIHVNPSGCSARNRLIRKAINKSI